MKKKINLRHSAGLFVLVLLVATSNAQNKTSREANNKSVEGVYELVAQEVNTTKPHKESYSLTPPRWTGMWHFQQGYFSSVLMKDRRDEFFECEPRELGYESFAGTYTLNGDEILFKQHFSLHPFYKGRPVVMKYTMKDNTLTLIQAVHPGIEDMTEATVKITLKRVSKKKR